MPTQAENVECNVAETITIPDVLQTFEVLRPGARCTRTAILTLAFGIGATTAIFSLVEGVLLRPLPFADPDKLIVLGDRTEGST